MSGGGSSGSAAPGGASPVTLRVLEIFDSLQGEGYWTGVPMTFVRLAGCNAPDLGLGCVRWCDTRDSWSALAGEDVGVEAIVERANYPRLCLTGGEPLLQLEGVAALLDAAHARGLLVHVETNGTFGPELRPVAATAAGRAGTGATAATGRAGFGSIAATCLDFDWVVVSPKPPDYVIAPGWEGLIDELKLVADEGLDTAVAERLAAAHPGAFVCIQPLAAPPSAGGGRGGFEPGGDPAAGSVKRAIDLVMSHPEWRLSLQAHKLLGTR
jgi:organic radical activating enzyme